MTASATSSGDPAWGPSDGVSGRGPGARTPAARLADRPPAERWTVTGAFVPGDPPGRRRFARFPGPVALQAGGRLPALEVAYETWGTLDADGGNAVLVLHALTGDSHVAGPPGPGHLQRGWWADVVGPGAAIDTDRWFVVCPNVLGGCQGTTGPASAAPDGRPYGSRFPVVTIRDQVAVETMLADHLGIGRWAAVVGGSMGGMRALEWCVAQPDRVARAVLLATCAAASAEQIAWCGLQLRAIRDDPAFAGGDYYDRDRGPTVGLELARSIGQLSYRTPAELEARFGRNPQGSEDPRAGGRYAVESYLAHHGQTLLHRFDANTYLVLTAAMDHHDVGHGRGGVARALGAVTADVTVVGISSDRLYPLAQQAEIAQALPGSPPLRVVDSVVGHDGFLVETAAVGAEIRRALER